MHESFVTRVRQTMATYQLIPSGARVVVGVSGGADSVALLHLLTQQQSEWRVTLHIAHIDHGLREASGDDAAFVEALGARWQIPCTMVRRDVNAICAKQGWSLEDGARRIRYHCFQEVARQQSATHLALAHTADDQAETVLMRLVRGTGLLGLGAIPIKRQLEDLRADGRQRQAGVWLVRPLLEVWRRDLLAYLKDTHVSYREDATNTDTRFMRNRIRHELLPLLERDYNPNIKTTLTQLAEQGRWDYAYLQACAGKQWKRLTKSPHQSSVSMTIRHFVRQPKALQRQLVRYAIQRVRGDLGQFEFRHWLEAERLFHERPVGTVVDLPGGVQLRREKEHVICLRPREGTRYTTSFTMTT